jgi:hypothetical protein
VWRCRLDWYVYAEVCESRAVSLQNISSVIWRYATARGEDHLGRGAVHTDELQSLRETLNAEGERVQREIIQYAALGQAAIESTKTLVESMPRWSRGRS